MKTVNQVLFFLNKVDFTPYLKDDDHQKLRCIKQVLTDEFQDVDSDKIMNMLIVVDDLYISFVTQEFQSVVGLTNMLRAILSHLSKKKWKRKIYLSHKSNRNI